MTSASQYQCLASGALIGSHGSFCERTLRRTRGSDSYEALVCQVVALEGPQSPLILFSNFDLTTDLMS